MAPAIQIENISKMYRINVRKEELAANSWRARLKQMATAPWRQLQLGLRVGSGMKEFWALRDVSFDVQPGEVVGIIGRNGAGKSTLLKLISRINRPTSGTIRFRGRVAALLEIGTGFHKELSGRENVFLNGTILGMSRLEIAQKFDEIVDFSGVEQFIDTPVKRYSSGMKARLAFAVAAHLRPDVLILDEVLAVGDVPFRKKSLEKISEFAKMGHTVLMVSHRPDAVKKLCNRTVLLDGGRVVGCGNTDEMLERYSAAAA